MAYVAEMQTVGDPQYYRNALVFETYQEAENYAKNLYSRWTGSTAYRVALSDETPNFKFFDGKLEAL